MNGDIRVQSPSKPITYKCLSLAMLGILGGVVIISSITLYLNPKGSDLTTGNTNSGTAKSMHDHGKTTKDCDGPCTSNRKKRDIPTTCATDSSCASGACSVNHICVANKCSDGLHNQNEPGTDCGGPCVSMNQTCPTGSHCNTPRDCQSDVCSGVRICGVNKCYDGLQNQGETGIDCGGPCASLGKTCGTGANCTLDADCQSGACSANHTCAVNKCSDGLQNQGETGIDCGGSCASSGKKCANGVGCQNGSDCITGSCVTNKCGFACSPSCKNNGTCIGNNNCSCPTGYIGATCDIQSTGLCFTNDTSSSAPLLLITFESGTPQYSSNTPAHFGFSTDYEQKFAGPVSDGSFGFVNAVPGDYSTWLAGSPDHTANDNDGYMFLINADITPSQIFNYTINNLCINSAYEISVYVANVISAQFPLLTPDVTFEVRAATAGYPLLATLNSGPIPQYNTLTWAKYGMSFVTPVSSVVLLMISDAPGGNGNDFAVDDIALRSCSNNGFCP